MVPFDAFNGMSQNSQKMSLYLRALLNNTIIIFIMSIVLVYFILAAQYESFWLPMAVILSIPTGIIGVFLSIQLAGIDIVWVHGNGFNLSSEFQVTTPPRGVPKR